MFDVAAAWRSFWIQEHKYLSVNLKFSNCQILFLWHWQINFRKFNYSHLVVANDLFDYLPALMIVVRFIC